MLVDELILGDEDDLTMSAILESRWVSGRFQ